MSKTAYNLQEFIQNPTSYTQISFHRQNLTDEDCIKLATVLEVNETITHFHLSDNQISDQGLAMLKSAWKGDTHDLDISDQKPITAQPILEIKVDEAETDLKEEEMFIVGELQDHENLSGSEC